MKKVILFFVCASATTIAQAQMVNSSSIHVSEGAVVSINTPVLNKGTISNNGKVHLKSDLRNEAALVSKGTISLEGTSPQVISGDSKINAATLEIRNDVNLKNEVLVSEEVNFVNGVVKADKALHFGENAKASGASDYSHVAGKVKKSGTETFQFPLGDGSSLKSFEVKNPNTTLEAAYVASSPLNESNELDISLSNINETEYWVIKSENKDKVNVNLNGGEELAALKNGVWVKQDKSLNAENGTKFTSGKGSYLQKEIGVWPNPTQGEFNLKLSGMRDADVVSIDITNQDGRIVMKMEGTVKELRKAYKLPAGLVTTNLTIRVINGQEAMTQNLILNR